MTTNQEAVIAYLRTGEPKLDTDIAAPAITFTQRQVDERVHQELQRYKQRLADTIRRYAAEHNLCNEGVKAFCGEMEIDYSTKYTASIVLVFEAEVDAKDEDDAHETFMQILSDTKRSTGYDYNVLDRYCEVQDIERA